MNYRIILLATPLVLLFGISAHFVPHSARAAVDDRLSEITLWADRAEYLGPCPREITLTGKIQAERPLGVVFYQFMHSDGTPSTQTQLTINSRGQFIVEERLRRTANWFDTVYLRVFLPVPGRAPTTQDSNRIAIKGECQYAQPVTRSESISLGPASGRFRVTLNGFTCNRQTVDDPLQADGRGDEVFLFTKSVFVEMRAGGSGVNTSPPMDLQTKVIGEYLPHHGRLQGGSGRIGGGLGTPINCCGGIRAGDSYPGDPGQHSNPRPALSLLHNDLPLLIWEGELRRRQSAVVIMPMIWEWDGYGSELLEAWRTAGFIYSSSTFVVGNLIADPNLTDQHNAKSYLRTDVANQLRFRLGEPLGVRPIGLRLGSTIDRHYRFLPELLILTYDEALRMALESQRNNGKAFPVVYADAPGDPWLGGNYTLYIQVEQLP